MNPNQAFANRTARLLAEGAHKPRVAYTSETKPVVREHITAIEIDGLMGRFWSHMPESEIDEFCARYPGDLSDICHSNTCWCQ